MLPGHNTRENNMNFLDQSNNNGKYLLIRNIFTSNSDWKCSLNFSFYIQFLLGKLFTFFCFKSILSKLMNSFFFYFNKTHYQK